MKMIEFMLNGVQTRTETQPDERLLDLLRNRLGLTGTKEGCGIGNCGACTVILDGKAVNACLIPALSIDGREVLTVEGIMQDGVLHPIQDALIRHHAVQCGFCTPGLVMSAKALLDHNPNPSRSEIQEAIAGNLCRCTGYEQVIEAVQDAAKGGENNADR